MSTNDRPVQDEDPVMRAMRVAPIVEGDAAEQMAEAEGLRSIELARLIPLLPEALAALPGCYAPGSLEGQALAIVLPAVRLLLAERADVIARPLAALRAMGFEVATAPAPLSVSIPHVWDIDGQPRGIRHSLTLSADGATLTARDECLDPLGEPISPSLDETSMPFVDAVHSGRLRLGSPVSRPATRPPRRQRKETAMGKRWEYALIERDATDQAEHVANQYGAEGWELVSHTTHKTRNDTTWCLSFKRRLMDANGAK